MYIYLQRQANKYDPEGDYLDDDSTVQGDTNEFRGAAYDGEMLKMSEMLGRKPDLLMSTDKKGTTALHFAVMGKNWDCCYYLLERGADLYAKTDFGTDALGFIHNDKVQVSLDIGVIEGLYRSCRGIEGDRSYRGVIKEL